MVKWPNMYLPTDFGGLGIMDTRTMNDSLICKWGWRVLRDRDDDMCVQLLKKKYMNRNSFWKCSNSAGSQFWKGVFQTRDLLKWGCKSVLRMDKTLDFGRIFG